MSSPTIGATFLVENAAAQHHHELGLQAISNDGFNFTEALAQMREAELIVSDDKPTVDSLVQTARVRRDIGFTMARQAIVTRELSLLDPAETELREAVQLTEVIVGNPNSAIPYDTGGTPNIDGGRKAARHEVFAEHGATLGLLGRFVTVKAVMEDVDTRGDSESAVVVRRDDQEYYGAAHDFLRVGNNSYYLISNAIAAARQEVLNGQRLRVLPWLHRAAQGLVRTSVKDSQDRGAAAWTLTSRLPDLRSYEVARESVLSSP